MSERPFESYLAQRFVDWVAQEVQPGFRYQFKSPDAGNALHLYQAFLPLSKGLAIEMDGIRLPYVQCKQTQLIPVLHGEQGFTENYISRLRDEVAGRTGPLADAALLIIHNSMLDTLINSAKDVASPGAIWHPERLEKELAILIEQTTGSRELLKCLLEDQLKVIVEDGATIFGFAPLYKTLKSGEVAFSELGLFNDPLVLSMTGQPAQARRRLEANRELHRYIQFAVDHYFDQLESVLKEYSAKFIAEHFLEQKNWTTLDYQDYLDEAQANQEQKLVLEEIIVDGCGCNQRFKSQTKAGKKEISLLVEVPSGQPQFICLLVFTGNDLEKEQIKIAHNKQLDDTAQIDVNRAGGKRCRATITLPFDGQPTFFSIELKRNNRAEEYKIRCLLVEQGHFYLDEIKNRFRVEPRHEWLTIQMAENRLQVRKEDGPVHILGEDDDEVDCRQFAFVDFEQLADQTEMIRFALNSGAHRLSLNIEGPAAEEGVSVPLLFDQDRFAKLFNDGYNAEFNRAKSKIIIDNSEISAVGTRLQVLAAEAKLLDEQLLFVGDGTEIKLSDIQQLSQTLYSAYLVLFDYLASHKTLPSLAAWGPEYQGVVQTVVDAYETALGEIPLNAVLSPAHQQLLRIGMFVLDGQEFISPFHPLVLSYHLNLVCHIEADNATQEGGSFAGLPQVTRERLIASGLLPFVYNNEAGFAHVVPLKENVFWLALEPHKQAGHGYVQRLVKDKLAEFTDAYDRLFMAGSHRSALIINAINQGVARELLFGLVDHFKVHKEKSCAIHVNFYDNTLLYNDFDRFAETASYDELKSWLGLASSENRADADMLIDLVRSRLTYSKFVTPKEDQPLAYAHLAFFINNAPVDSSSVHIEESLSGVLCDGLIAGEAAETKGTSYFTAFGLRGVDIKNHQHLRLARLIGTLFKPARKDNEQNLGAGIGLAVGAEFKQLLMRSYDSALWTTIIDPKVTLDFFTNQQDVVLIHYSDQYTSAVGYDAITVTKQVDLFKRILGSDHLLGEFNAFNGEWLLKMLTADAKQAKEKRGIIGAYKFVSALLRQSDITWVPLSVAEMIRVSGNVGLRMDESEFSRNVHGYRKGAISDDVLFVGFKGEQMYLLPLEVKTGSRPDYNYAGEQAQELKRYLTEDVLGSQTLAARLYRGLFIRQVLMQVDKLRLYNVLSDNSLSELLDKREWWLRGVYNLAELDDYVSGFVVAHVENDTCVEPRYLLTKANILQAELPYGLLDSLIQAQTGAELDGLVAACHTPNEYRLLPKAMQPVQESPQSAQAQADAQSELSEVHLEPEEPPQPQKPLKVLFGREVLREAPVYWEPTNTAKFMNTNTGIIGTMGTGKTQFTKSLISQLVQNQFSNVDGQSIGVLIFDYKSDYVDDAFVKSTQAKKFKLHKLPYNPLSLFGDMPMLTVHTATGFAETMARAFGLGQKQQLRLRKLILDAYEQAGISKSDASTWSRPAPTIEDIWQLFLSQEKVEQDSLYAALDSLATYEIFESNNAQLLSLYELVNNVTIIELAGYSPQIQNLVVALTLDIFYSHMQKKGKPAVQGDFRQITKMILVDEADNFMSQDFPSLRKILKEGREYGVGVILSTQDITHFKTGENNYASYVLTWVIHRVSEIKNADIKAIFNKDDKAEQEALMEIIRKLDKHYSLYVNGEKQLQKIRDKAFWELQGGSNNA